MLEKFKELLGSRRFWILTFTAVLGLLKLDPVTIAGIFTVIQVWLLGVVAIGTWDKVWKK